MFLLSDNRHFKHYHQAFILFSMILSAILFVVLGVLIKNFKMYFLMAGYNMMPKEEKEKYNVEGVATVFRNAMFGMAGIIVLGNFLADFINYPELERYSFYTAMAIGIPYLLVVSNSKKYRKD